MFSLITKNFSSYIVKSKYNIMCAQINQLVFMCEFNLSGWELFILQFGCAFMWIDIPSRPTNLCFCFLFFLMLYRSSFFSIVMHSEYSICRPWYCVPCMHFFFTAFLFIPLLSYKHNDSTSNIVGGDNILCYVLDHVCIRV